jgi:membrane-bound lytic murein transglycosylase D
MKFIKNIITITLLALAAYPPAMAVNPWIHDSITRAEVDPVMLSLDSMSYQLFTRDKFFASSDELQRSINLPKDQLPSYSPSEMKQRMKMIPAIIPMDYNADVQAFIDLFVYRKRDLMTKLLANSQIYFPLFEEVLDKNKMPDELKYLPVIESALNPQAVSSAGATGLWQMMYSTGKMMGLDANSYVDERRDPAKSTVAGVKYLKQLYDLYGDWQLALAAYNSGPGYVNKAIARAGGVKNFWAIKNMLPAETRSYVPTFLAVVYAMHYHKDYKLLSAEPKRELYAVDTIMIPSKVTLRHISQTLNIPLDELQFLNPSVKAGIIPQMPNGFALNLPVNYFATFEAKKDVIMNDPEIMLQASTADMYANPTMVRVPRYVYYRVRRGESIHNIAARYGVGVNEIKEWNHLRGNALAKGQSIKILTFPEVPVYQAQNTAPKQPAQQAASSTPAPKESNNSVSTANATADSNQSGSEEVQYFIEEGTDKKVAVVKNVDSTPKAPEPAKPVIRATAPIKASAVKYYRVQNGDTLWSIVQHYPGLTINKLKADNRMGRSSALKKGQVLKIIL